MGDPPGGGRGGIGGPGQGTADAGGGASTNPGASVWQLAHRNSNKAVIDYRRDHIGPIPEGFQHLKGSGTKYSRGETGHKGYEKPRNPWEGAAINQVEDLRANITGATA